MHGYPTWPTQPNLATSLAEADEQLEEAVPQAIHGFRGKLLKIALDLQT